MKTLLDRDGDAVQWTERLAASLAVIGCLGISQRLFKPGNDDRVESRIDGLDPCDKCLGGITGRNLAANDTQRNLGRGPVNRAVCVVYHAVRMPRVVV